jgi:hypothetical protein
VVVHNVLGFERTYSYANLIALDRDAQS